MYLSKGTSDFKFALFWNYVCFLSNKNVVMYVSMHFIYFCLQFVRSFMYFVGSVKIFESKICMFGLPAGGGTIIWAEVKLVSHMRELKEG